MTDAEITINGLKLEVGFGNMVIVALRAEIDEYAQGEKRLREALKAGEPHIPGCWCNTYGQVKGTCAKCIVRSALKEVSK